MERQQKEQDEKRRAEIKRGALEFIKKVGC